MAAIFYFLCILYSVSYSITLSRRPYCDDREDNETNHQYPSSDPEQIITSNYINTDFMDIPFSLIPGKCQSVSIDSSKSRKWECKNANTLLYYQYSDRNCQSDNPMIQTIYNHNNSKEFKNSHLYGGFSCDYDTNQFAKVLFTWHTNNCTQNLDLTIDVDDADVAILYIAINTCSAFNNAYSKLYCAKQNYQSEAKGAPKEDDPIRFYGELQLYATDMSMTEECDTNQFSNQFVIDDGCSVLEFDDITLDAQMDRCSFEEYCAPYTQAVTDDINTIFSFKLYIVSLIGTMIMLF